MKSKYNHLLVTYNQLKEEKEKQALLHSEEVAKRDDAEQQLAKVKSDLAKLKAEQDDFQIVVCVYCILQLLHFTNKWVGLCVIQSSNDKL